VNAKQFSASWTSPPFLFAIDELPYADRSYPHEIFDHAHAVLGSIAFIQVIQPVAGKRVAPETVRDLPLSEMHAVLDTAGKAGYRFDAVIESAAGARVLLSHVRDAEAAVHAAGSD